MRLLNRFLPPPLKNLLKGAYHRLKFLYGKVFKNSYFEHFGRVYSADLIFDADSPGGRLPTTHERAVYLNYQQEYKFCAQFCQGDVVMDAGCGSGHGAQTIVGLGGATNYYDIDASKHAIDYARKMSANSRARFDVQSVTNLRLDSGMFDVVLCLGVLGYLVPFGTLGRAVAECCRVLKKGGLFVASIPNYAMFQFRHRIFWLLYTHALLAPLVGLRRIFAGRLQEKHSQMLLEKIETRLLDGLKRFTHDR